MEPEGGGVDAVPQACRLGPVFEHVPQVGTAVGALDLGSTHEQASIPFLPHALLIGGRPEARPARPGVVLCPRGKELVPADDAKINTGLVMIPVCSGEGALGPIVDADLVLQRRKSLLDFRLVELLHKDKRTVGRFKFWLGADLMMADLT